MAATVNGVTLAALFYHHQSSSNDQEGFLFGKVLKNVEDTISDTQINNTQLQTTIYITDFLPWNKDIILYGTNCYLDKEMLESVLQGRGKDVIGWYSCRRNTSMRVSMKEATLHRNLLVTLIPEYPEDFLFLLSTSFISPNLSTHSFDHALYRYRYSTFSKIKVNILNLGDTTHTHYKKQSPLSVSHKPDTLQTSFLSFRNKFENKSGEMIEVKNIQELSHCLHEQLVSITSSVKESEQNLSSLEQEVQQLALELKQEEDLKTKKLENVPKDSWQPSLLDTSIEIKTSDNIDSQLKIDTVNSDMLPNAYSIKLEELDNQVLDLDRPSTSAANLETKPSRSKYDDSWLDISIDSSTSTGVTTQTTVMQPTKTTILHPKTTTSKQPTQTSLTTQEHNIVSKEKAQSQNVELKETAHTTTIKQPLDASMKSIRSRTTKNKTNEVKSSDPFSFVESMLSKDGKPIDPLSDTVPKGRIVKMPKAVMNQKESVQQSEKSVTPSQNRKESSRTSSSERQTRQNKTQKAQSETKQDVSVETRMERAKTHRAKTRSGQPHSRRSLSREDKKDTSTMEGKKESLSKDKSKSAKVFDSEVNNVEKKRNSTDCKSSIPDKKEDYILTDDETLPSSSPVF